MLKKILGELMVAVLVAVILAVGAVVCYSGYKAISDPLVKTDEEIHEIRNGSADGAAKSSDSGKKASAPASSAQEQSAEQAVISDEVSDGGEMVVENSDVQQSVNVIDENSGGSSEDGADGESVAAGSEMSVYGLIFKLPEQYRWRFNLGGNGYFFRPDENTYSPILIFHSVAGGDQEINDSSYNDIMNQRIEMLKSKLGQDSGVDQDETTTINGIPCRKFITHTTEDGQQKKSAAYLLYNADDHTIAEVDFSGTADEFNEKIGDVNGMVDGVRKN